MRGVSSESPQQRSKARRCWDSAGRASVSSVHNLKTVFFDDRVGEHFFRNVLELFLGLVTAPAIEIQNEKLALPDITHGGVTKPREGVLNRLPLRIKHRAF